MSVGEPLDASHPRYKAYRRIIITYVGSISSVSLGLTLQTFRDEVRRLFVRNLPQRPREAGPEQGVPSQVLHVRHVSQAVVDRRGAVCNRRESVHL